MCASVAKYVVVKLLKAIGEIMKRLCQTLANGRVQAILIKFKMGAAHC